MRAQRWRRRWFWLLSLLGSAPLLLAVLARVASPASLWLMVPAVALAWAIATIMSRPLEDLLATAERIGDGDLRASPSPLLAGEWGQLAQAIVSLAGRLSSLTRDFDQRVSDRTEALTRKASQLRAVSQVGHQVAAVLEPEALLHFVVRVMRGTFGYDIVAALLRRDNDLVVTACAARNFDSVPLGGVFPLQSPSFTRLVPGIVARDELTMPMRLADRVVGMLVIQSLTAAAFDAEDEFTVETIASQVAVALENARLLAAERHLRVLSIAEERNRMAREIHDTLAQGFVGIIMQLRAMKGAADANAAQAHLREAETLAHESLREARRSVWDLRPLQLEEHDLGQALASELAGLRRRTGLAGELQIDGDVRRIGPSVEVALLRIAQEALHNTVKHAHASHISVELTVEAHEVRLTVADDGVGFTTPPDTGDVTAGDTGGEGGFGLRGMAERARVLGGVLAVRSAPGAGCRVTAIVPLGRSS